MVLSAGGKESALPLSSEVNGAAKRTRKQPTLPRSSEVQLGLAQVANNMPCPSPLRCSGA
eukprot:3581341-Prorocentrum_lima.AAC.1